MRKIVCLLRVSFEHHQVNNAYQIAGDDPRRVLCNRFERESSRNGSKAFDHQDQHVYAEFLLVFLASSFQAPPLSSHDQIQIAIATTLIRD